MRAFDVFLNQKKLCRAGIGEDGILSAIVSWVTGKDRVRGKHRRELFLDVGGLVSPANEFVDWTRQKPLRVGDRVQVRIVETELIDKPTKRRRSDPAEDLKRKKRYVRMMAKELGWKIQSRSK